MRLALELLREPHQHYQHASDPDRREINQAFVEHVRVYQDTIEPTYHQPFNDFVEAGHRYNNRYNRVATRSATATAPTNDRRPR